MEWLTLLLTLAIQRGGWALLVVGLVLLLLANWKGWIVGGAEHQRALTDRDTWRRTAEKQDERLDEVVRQLEGISKSQGVSQGTLEEIVRALRVPRGSARR